MIKNSSYCFADVFCPESLRSLGDLNQWRSYEKHVPELIPLATKLNNLYYRGDSTITSTNQSLTKSTLITRNPRHDRPEYSRLISSLDAIKALIGRVELHVNHNDYLYDDYLIDEDTFCAWWEHVRLPTPLHSSTSYFIQVFSYINPHTREIDDNAALSYLENAKAAGYVAYLYRCSKTELGCIVSVRERLTYKNICKISATLAAKIPEVNPHLNSLFIAVRMLLSPIFPSNYCSLYKTDDSIETVLNQLLIITANGTDENDSEEIDFEESEHYKEQKSHPNYPVGFVVDSEVRNQIVSYYNTTDPALLNIIGHHLYGTWKDGDYSVVNVSLMELLTGEKNQRKKYISKWLDQLKEIADVDVLAHIPGKKATAYKINNVPEHLIYPKHKIIDTPVLLSNEKIREYAGKMYEAKRNYSRECPTKYPNSVSLTLVDYLNNLPTNTFTSRINTNWQDIKSTIDGMDEDAKNDAISSINHIKVCPQPIYKQAENSSRIYAVGPSFQTIKKLIRNLVFSDCEKADLLHAQLSIASNLFGAEELIHTLKTGNAWNILTEKSGLHKGTIKSILYACLYSNSYDVDEYKSLKNHTREEVAKFFSVEEMSYFFRCRRDFLTNNFYGIKEDVFGNELQGTDSQKLSALIQSYELKLLQPAIEYLTLLKDRKIKIVLWLHDGFYYICPTRERLRINNKLMKLVNEQCNKLNIPSRLIIG